MASASAPKLNPKNSLQRVNVRQQRPSQHSFSNLQPNSEGRQRARVECRLHKTGQERMIGTEE